MKSDIVLVSVRSWRMLLLELLRDDDYPDTTCALWARCLAWFTVLIPAALGAIALTLDLIGVNGARWYEASLPTWLRFLVGGAATYGSGFLIYRVIQPALPPGDSIYQADLPKWWQIMRRGFCKPVHYI